jgi:transposase
MRYPDGGGLTVVEQAKREAVRMEAADMFAAGTSGPVVAARTRVSRQSGWRWQKAFEAGGAEALRSKGPHGKCRLSEQQIQALKAALEQGPAVHGWTEDQRWTLARICRLTFELFKVRYTPKGMSLLLKRNGWSVQVPAVRAAERNEEAIAAWRDEQWPIIKGRRASWTPTSASKTKPDPV